MSEGDRGADVTVVIVGAAGEGIQTIGGVLAEAVALAGHPVFTWQEFESRIRGGNSSITLRICDRHPSAPSMLADILLALNDGALAHYRERARPGGVIVRQGSRGETEEERTVPFLKIAREEHGGDIYANTIAAGYLGAALGLPVSYLEKALERAFRGKGEEVAAANVRAARAGYALAAGVAVSLPSRPDTEAGGPPKYLLTGHEALAVAAANSGLRFIAAYPMSPSTSIISHLARRQEELGLFLVQAEDEIAAINMVLGASYGGARAMTCTSGGGFALMVEALSLAGMTETPAVVVLAMRPGPATGLPTRTAQGDLLFAVNAGHGEFPKAVLAPADGAEVFPVTLRAFHLADKYQMPVVILTDQHLADSRYEVQLPALDQTLKVPFLADPDSVELPYRRYRLGGSPVSPRLWPGQSDHLVRADSDEHDEEGHITEDLKGTVPAMVRKRREKLKALRGEMRGPLREGPPDAELTLVSWGSTLHAVREAADELNRWGRPTAILHFTDLWPLPEIDPPAGTELISVEANGSGQLARLLHMEAGFRFHRHIGRIDGLPIDAGHILAGLGEEP